MTFRPHVYVQTDVPPGVSLRAWRREQPAQSSQPPPPPAGAAVRVALPVLMSRHLAGTLRQTARALRLVADLLSPPEPHTTVVRFELDGRQVAEAVRRNGGGDSRP
jgi:hypothetical protein